MNELAHELAQILLTAPDSHFDSCMKPLVESWKNPPTPLQVLEVLDHCVHSSLASGAAVMVLQDFYGQRCKEESTTHDEVVKGATWRS